ncbi:MAG: homocysteine S-methyltransferase family protein [Treponema sp.]|jgi:5-methyltetrahydrofolate--homocysteine methyltransferase|nr:homocysteine S-methyltransferase family protein [Treponema sp.]
MNIREKINAIAKERILILDGAMGSLIQAEHLSEEDFRGMNGSGNGRFAGHPIALKGCNDILCLSKPELISRIHRDYLQAGADIIETCSFNSTAVSLADYGLADMTWEISRAAAALARKAADAFSTPRKPRFVAGSIGPTAKSASISNDMEDLSKRNIYWDELAEACYDNARGLLDGGADILLLETIFDTLNAKAALFAISRLCEERNEDIPVMISATVYDENCRILSGQKIDAFAASVLHVRPLSIGLNCSFGAEKLKEPLKILSDLVPCLSCAYPNAGLPNQEGNYDEDPESMASKIEDYFKEGLVNIIGGCCGTTPAHIARIAEKAAQYKPRLIPSAPQEILLSGLKLLKPGKTQGPVIIGGQTNDAGHNEFFGFIREGNYDDAIETAQDMIENGASIINVCMDSTGFDGAGEAIRSFINLAQCFQAVAAVPFMIGGTDFDVIEKALKCLQGKPVAASLNLKDGKAEFLRKARLAGRYGAAVAVTLIDEQGEAVSLERKIAVAEQSYKLLAFSASPPEDIIIDPLVFPLSSEREEEASSALNFIRCSEWIRKNCPKVQILGNVSKLSSGFPGNDTVRNAIHGVFLKHAGEAGLSMAIVDPKSLCPYDEIETGLRETIEDLIFHRKPDALKRLRELS